MDWRNHSFAPLSRNNVINSWFMEIFAWSRVVRPSRPLALMSAPPERSAAAASGLPTKAVHNSGVNPRLSRATVFAWCASRTLMISGLPIYAAACNGCQPRVRSTSFAFASDGCCVNNSSRPLASPVIISRRNSRNSSLRDIFQSIKPAPMTSRAIHTPAMIFDRFISFPSENDLSTHDGQHHAGFQNVRRVNFENVPVQHDDVRQFSGRQGAFGFLGELREGRTNRVRPHRFLNGKLLFRYPAIGMPAVLGLARHGRVNSRHRVQRRDRP